MGPIELFFHNPILVEYDDVILLRSGNVRRTLCANMFSANLIITFRNVRGTFPVWWDVGFVKNPTNHQSFNHVIISLFAIYAMMSHEWHGVPNHQQLDCFVQQLVHANTKETIIKAPHYWPCVGTTASCGLSSISISGIHCLCIFHRKSQYRKLL